MVITTHGSFIELPIPIGEPIRLGVEGDGVLFEEESDITDQVVDFYKRLYQEPEAWRPTIDGLEFACLDEIC